ncbi:hypothetical protein W97_06881 [Coniosporium apollinis CBS 100218]|uniref:Deacetylase complex subunit Sds3 n=1 Tax=Coniosporium apollinis (strain CBS 100218) TaxID=1168221 RepID=R7Z0A2_CONA1|nr:uncharacterized protein W97_06881 [Coniosporium apollinis CBS 100218]EON67513.1 hypothetical protein W97_06881 [Coniosporium apollinis CBS 100218]
MARTQSPSPGDFASTGSPPPHPQTKRDKRRTMLSDRLNDMVASFAENREMHYRAQMQAVQVDMNLIMHADPYANNPLEDSPLEIAEMITAGTGGSMQFTTEVHSDYLARVGRFYEKFVDDVNSEMEKRDYQLTMLWNKAQSSVHELNQTHAYRVRLAEEEHRQLANTLRDRLITSIGSRRAKLVRDKEQLDISDNNAQLLNPNQYTIAPGSPGGPQNPRKTRHTRHRVGDPEDLVAAAAEKQRKRKAALEENDNGSPGLAQRNADLGFGSPFRDARTKKEYTQFEAGAYTIDRLFTEKELAMTMNHASLAATSFFAKAASQTLVNGHAATALDSLPNGDVPQLLDAPDNDMTNAPTATATATATDPDSASPSDASAPALAAPEMERQPSHATRATTRTAPPPSLSAAVLRALPPHPGASAVPVILPANLASKPNAAAPPPAPLSAADIESDLAFLGRGVGAEDPWNERLLDAAVGGVWTRQVEVRAPGWVGGGVPEVRALEEGFGEGEGGVVMSSQASSNGGGGGGGGGGRVGGGLGRGRFDRFVLM